MKVREMSNKDISLCHHKPHFCFLFIFQCIYICKHFQTYSVLLLQKWLCQGFCYRANEDTSRPISTLACSPISEECNGRASLVDTKLDTPETF